MVSAPEPARSDPLAAARVLVAEARGYVLAGEPALVREVLDDLAGLLLAAADSASLPGLDESGY